MPPTLTDLPTCILLVILSYVDATGLYVLSRISRRLNEIITHHSLWRRVDARRDPNESEKSDYCLSRIHLETHTLLFHGLSRNVGIPELPRRILDSNKLTVLALEFQLIQCPMAQFPKGLRELSLRTSRVRDVKGFFKGAFEHLRDLRVLILDECEWVTSFNLMAISKFPQLEILSLFKCPKVKGMIPYLTLSGKFGFKAIRLIDARLTRLSTSFLSTFFKSRTLQAIYLQSRDLTYKFDYLRHRMELIRRGHEVFNHEDPLFIQHLDRSTGFVSEGLDFKVPLESRTLLDYVTTTSEVGSRLRPLPQSVLYVDPYQETCNCPRDIDSREPPSDYHCGDTIRDLITTIKTQRGLHLKCDPVADNPDAAHLKWKAYYSTRLKNGAKRKRSPSPRPSNKKQKTVVEPSGSHLTSDTSDSDSSDDGPSFLNGPVSESVRFRMISVDFDPVDHDDRPMDLVGVRIYRVVDADKNVIPLKRLSLRGYEGVNDDVFGHLKDLDLEVLDVTYTGVTLDGINRYLREHRDCRVVHHDLCVCPVNLFYEDAKV